MKSKLICRICGAEYDGCRTAKATPGQFRWQDVACCPEHGSLYFEKILESRKKPSTEGESTVAPISAESTKNKYSQRFKARKEDLLSEDED